MRWIGWPHRGVSSGPRAIIGAKNGTKAAEEESSAIALIVLARATNRFRRWFVGERRGGAAPPARVVGASGGIKSQVVPERD